LFEEAQNSFLMQSTEHYAFMQLAVKYGEVALKKNEVPVTAILVHNQTKEILYSAHNMTNITLNGTAHAEFIIYKYLMDKYPELHLTIWKNSTLYVTVEPCIMCASMLDQIGISMIVFGCPNERFGGNGSVFNIRYNSKYEIVPGVCLKESISLLRRFYINENDRSPNTINKKKRILKLDEFPKLKYSQFITCEEFIEIWGEKYLSIYENDDFLEFDKTTGELKLPNTIINSNSKKLKI
jgi:tRNA-specific adenosine deaminase 2